MLENQPKTLVTRSTVRFFLSRRYKLQKPQEKQFLDSDFRGDCAVSPSPESVTKLDNHAEISRESFIITLQAERSEAKNFSTSIEYQNH